MKKILLILLISLSFLTGCENKEEDEKSEYLAMKSSLLENEEYTGSEKIICDIVVDVERLDEEKIEYNVSLSNPKENMKDIKAIVVHNYYTEEVFPTIGLFDKTTDLYVNSEEDNDEIENNINLSGTIKTTADIDKLDLELKVLVEYVDESGEKKDIYYKTTK